MTSEEAKSALDVVSVTATVSALIGWLPAVAAVLSIVWTLIRIWETDTVRQLFNRDD
jgi:hypothetical protein